MTIEERIEYEFESHRLPGVIQYELRTHSDILKAGQWEEGQRITKYNIPIFSDDSIQAYMLGPTTFQGEILIVSKPVEKRKFRRYHKQDIK